VVLLEPLAGLRAARRPALEVILDLADEGAQRTTQLYRSTDGVALPERGLPGRRARA
jgi:hypothetical protein